MVKPFILLIWWLGIFSACQSQPFRLYSCPEAGIEFKLPSEFAPIGKNKERQLAERGTRVENEVFPDAKSRTWQPTCINPLAAGNNIVFTILSIKYSTLESDHKSYSDFLEYYFKEQKYFFENRFRSKSLLLDKLEATQKDLKIAGLAGRKIKLIASINQGNIIYVCYLIRVKDRVYQFTHIGKNLDFAQSVEHGVEQAVAIR